MKSLQQQIKRLSRLTGILIPIALFLLLISTPQNVHSQLKSKHSLNAKNANNSESYQSLTFNGAWCWFSDPRAVYYEGQYKRTYSGWVDNYGDIHVAFYDHDTKKIHSRVIYDNLETDDHDNPSILFDEKGKLLVFFNKHMLGVQPLYLIKASEPESIDTFGKVKELHLNNEADADLGTLNHTYTNPIKLSAENGRIYLFWRGTDGKPSYSYSDDNGDNWSTGKIFFMPERTYGFRRPYTKVYSNGIDKIHFTVTDGHPRNEKTNSIYYMYYKNGAFFKANGTKIKDVEDLPITPSEVDKIYDGTASKAWNWDIAEDVSGNPIVAYAKFPDDNNHIYCYANWNGKWNNRELINSGSWFPQDIEGQYQVEPNYSGGISIDHENPNTLYLSVKRDSIFEIEKWETKNSGKSWKVSQITNGSSKNNIRPFAVRGAKEGNPLQVLWMQNTNYYYFAYLPGWGDLKKMTFKDRYLTSIKSNILSPAIDNPLTQDGIKNIMRQTADWQLANPRKIHPVNWENGALYTGIRALYELTEDQRYKDELINIGQAQKWKPMNDIFHADRLTIIDNWAWLYEQEKDPDMIDKSQWVLDIHLARNYKKATDVRFKNNPNDMEWWTWCDALYMAPPSFVQMWKVTGEEKYLSYMDTQWWKTSDYLYSPKDSLYFRDDRFFDQISENGTNIFWSRGNGWVIAGLARILALLPEDYPGRDKFENQYSEMAHKLLSIQDEDGLWRVSLIDPEYLNIGESSGSSFFTYALAWGLNNGRLDAKYKPQVEKAWKALCNNVNEQGRLGYVQQVAGDPYPFYEDQSHVYATGAFLLAGKEMHRLISNK
ncbi:MAG: glycoside hydrolase family 88 protein [Cyclobacteriaceae bacterium]